MGEHQHEHGHDHGHGGGNAERHCDVAVVGGSAAGLAAALQLGRQRRSVIVVDAGEPRNAPAAHMHGYLGHEGVPPAELSGLARAEVRSYGAEIVQGRVVDVTRTEGSFRVHLVGGNTIVARRVLAATGLVDDLPDIDGIAEHWGSDVVHCPFCHGYEVRDQPVVQVLTHPLGLHATALWRQLTDRLTVVVHEPGIIDDAELAGLRSAGVSTVDGAVERIVARADGRVTAVDLADGSTLDCAAVAVGPRFRVRAEPFASLGLETVAHPSGLGDHVTTDDTGATSVPGLYAAGNVADPSHQVLHAAANGSRVGALICVDLAHEDLDAAARPSSNQVDWDHRYGGGRMWSGNANGSLVAEVDGSTPGRALDVGAGEGGDAIWLAEHGWRVTASDISQRALDLVADEARRRDLPVDLLHADANALDPFEPAAFDLVTAMYASIPRTPDDRAIRNLLGAVGPDGTLLVVSHDLEPMRAQVDTTVDSGRFDPDAYVRVEDIAAALADDPTWHVEVHETRPRPPGAATTHHVDDVVLRARRRSL